MAPGMPSYVRKVTRLMADNLLMAGVKAQWLTWRTSLEEYFSNFYTSVCPSADDYSHPAALCALPAGMGILEPNGAEGANTPAPGPERA